MKKQIKVSFLIQNNIQSHLLNALIVGDILRHNNIIVHTCYISNELTISKYFKDNIGCEIIRIDTPLLYKRSNIKNFFKSFLKNIFNIHKYIKSAQIIKNNTKDDAYIFNFYEPINFYYQLIKSKTKTNTISI